jgi:2-methylcitrate dehydratase PrpD
MNKLSSDLEVRAPASVQFASHVVNTRFEDLPADLIDLAKIFILDTLGVGIAGSTADGAAQLLAASTQWGTDHHAVVWGTGQLVPAPTAALINAFQSHCQEFDCVHETGVLHPMTALLPAALAYASRNRGVSGRELLVAVVTGVDVAATLGLASKSPLRFFRPATAGGFGAAAAVARLAGLDVDGTASALGAQYAQTCGTLQPHIEGSVVMPMQVGFNARAALESSDMAAQGIQGPIETFEGEYGFMRLFEGEWDLRPHLEALGTDWQIRRVSHKPYPAGRAGHGAVEGVMRFLEERPFADAEIAGVKVVGPPLIHQLTGRPDVPQPSGNYARLCAAFIGAKVLQNGSLDIEHYRGAELTDARTHDLARLFSVEVNDVADPNLLVPHDVIVTAKDGREWRWRCESMLASPLRRLSRESHLAKFRRCCSFAAVPMRPEAIEALIEMVDRLDTLDDVVALTDLLAA